MLLRPVDASGDILPVLSSSDLVSGAEAVVILARDRLNLLWHHNIIRYQTGKQENQGEAGRSPTENFE